MKYNYRNPQNGYTESVSNWAFLWTLLFGSLYFAVKGAWAHVFVSAILAILTVGISWLIYPFFATAIVQSSYLKKGWVEV